MILSASWLAKRNKTILQLLSVITILLFKLIGRIQVNTFHANIILLISALIAWAAPDTGLWWMSLCIPENFDISFTLDLAKPCHCRKVKLMSKCSADQNSSSGAVRSPSFARVHLVSHFFFTARSSSPRLNNEKNIFL